MEVNKSIVNDDSVVIKEQKQIEVFANSNGGISITMKGWDGNDQVVWFFPEYAEKVIFAIRCAVDDLEGEDA